MPKKKINPYKLKDKKRSAQLKKMIRTTATANGKAKRCTQNYRAVNK